MRILSIETSADETAVSIVEADGDFPHATYTILGNALNSQVKVHEEYGGIYPSIAKREHAKILTPLLERALKEAGLFTPKRQPLTSELDDLLRTLLHREPDMTDAVIEFLSDCAKPPIDAIAVTSGPGLEPTLWVGINFAKALALVWDVPVVPVNHMEGHILASLMQGAERKKPKAESYEIAQVEFPALALLISGGHTEFDLMQDWLWYECIGETRDDAVGEAFDKTARLMGLPYPGGPQISALAAKAREEELPQFLSLPKPMLDSGDLDLSFSGLKTAVRYGIEGKKLKKEDKKALARDLEDTITEVLLRKAQRAVDETGARSLIIGGGVSANEHIRATFTKFFEKEYPDLSLYVPPPSLSTDNSIMIALAGHARLSSALPAQNASREIKAEGNRTLY